MSGGDADGLGGRDVARWMAGATSDIFISYSRDDLAKAKQLATALEQEGWSVWWDQEIPPGKTWADYIGAQTCGGTYADLGSEARVEEITTCLREETGKRADALEARGARQGLRPAGAAHHLPQPRLRARGAPLPPAGDEGGGRQRRHRPGVRRAVRLRVRRPADVAPREGHAAHGDGPGGVGARRVAGGTRR
jgi:hypothetical protein